MTQTAIVTKIQSDQIAEIEVQRQSACGHDCDSCGAGCNAGVKNKIKTQAVNKIGAVVGEKVIIEGDNKTVYKAAAIIYAVPIILFFALYALGQINGLSDGMSALTGGAGFIAGILGALSYNRYMKRKGVQPYVIVQKL